MVQSPDIPINMLWTKDKLCNSLGKLNSLQHFAKAVYALSKCYIGDWLNDCDKSANRKGHNDSFEASEKASEVT
jgi:arginyl-tRNA--protein-N-Asp/Glu arginylyltransferase